MLEMRDIRKAYVTPQGPLPVLDGVDPALPPGRAWR